MTSIIIIGTGEPCRLKALKPLVLWQGKPLIRHSAEVALEARLGPVTVVPGAAEADCRAALADLPVRMVHHPYWFLGVSGSVASGVTSLTPCPSGNILIMMCDQPLIDAAHLRKLSAEFKRNGDGIVATRPGTTNGPPVLFPPDAYPHLRSLRGSRSVRARLYGTPMLSWVQCPAAACCLDTPGDLFHLRSLEYENAGASRR